MFNLLIGMFNFYKTPYNIFVFGFSYGLIFSEIEIKLITWEI